MSGRDSWETPQWLFDWLDKQYYFNLDVAAIAKNTKCQIYCDDGLLDSWDYDFEAGILHIEGKSIVFCNPPYSNIMSWLSKAQREIRKERCEIAVFILPQDLSIK